MKAIVCGTCKDFRALRVGCSVKCACGNVEGWWVDPEAGTVKVYARERERAKIMGVHNGLLAFAWKQHDFSPQGWRENHEILTSDEFAKGYVFHKDVRGCPVAIIPVGATPDTSWSDVPFDFVGSTPISKLEDALEDARELAQKLCGTEHEPLISGLNVQIEHALGALGWRP